MSENAKGTPEPDPATDRHAYSRVALARLVLSYEQRDLADAAAAGVPTDDSYSERGDMVREATRLVERAQQVLTAAVVYERYRHTSWEIIGEALGGISRQSAHERYREAMDGWERALIEPYEPTPPGWTGYRTPVLHEAALEPTRTARLLDEWTREHVRSARTDEHPVSGHLPPLTTTEEMVQVLAATRQLSSTGAGPIERAAVYERKAALLERIAAEDGKPEAAEQAAEARAVAHQLRAQRTD